METLDKGLSSPLNRLSVAVETPQHAGLGGVLDYLSTQAWPAGTQAAPCTTLKRASDSVPRP